MIIDVRRTLVSEEMEGAYCCTVAGMLLVAPGCGLALGLELVLKIGLSCYRLLSGISWSARLKYRPLVVVIHTLSGSANL